MARLKVEPLVADELPGVTVGGSFLPQRSTMGAIQDTGRDALCARFGGPTGADAGPKNRRAGRL